MHSIFHRKFICKMIQYLNKIYGLIITAIIDTFTHFGTQYQTKHPQKPLKLNEISGKAEALSPLLPNFLTIVTIPFI